MKTLASWSRWRMRSNDESLSSPHATASPSMMQERKRSLRNDMGRYIEGHTDTSRVSDEPFRRWRRDRTGVAVLTRGDHAASRASLS
jgi:hypothetical protein